MKIKTKLLTCVGAMVWLTTAILPGSAMATATRNYSENAESLIQVSNPSEFLAAAWCEKGISNGATCCSKDKGENLGRPGTISVPVYNGGQGKNKSGHTAPIHKGEESYGEAVCDLFGNYDSGGKDMSKPRS